LSTLQLCVGLQIQQQRHHDFVPNWPHLRQLDYSSVGSLCYCSIFILFFN
jgi:hypothetical protein